MTDLRDLLARVERLEALDEIRQLAAKYTVCVDMRDLDALVNLFVDDIGVPGKQRGREALRAWYDHQLRHRITGTAHGVHGHVIDVHDADHASGLVYSRNDLESEDTWMIEMMAYLDAYERRDGRWLFARRTPLFWYECDITNPPIGEGKLRWPGTAWSDGAFHDAFPSWAEFWRADPGRLEAPVRPPAPVGAWLRTLRRDQPTPRVQPGGGMAEPVSS